MNSPTFAKKLLAWFDEHGRHDLPWQQGINPYRVWVSEIMLQQTQVKTVIPYYERFMQRFPDVQALADADIDEVLQHWAGLGYYARGRNLHKAAQQVVNTFAGEFPTTLDDMISLPGIGHSTAGAILAIASQQRQPILDGNVKRVLTRLYGIKGWPGETQVANRLWQLADELTPKTRVADYTQAIMDLGATLCSRSRPQCEACPFKGACVAYQTERIQEYPGKKPKREKPTQEKRFLICLNRAGEVLMTRRPATGIWGGLWSLPETDLEQTLGTYVEENYSLKAGDMLNLEGLRHSFSHYHLQIHPVLIHTETLADRVADHANIRWIAFSELDGLGLPAPVKKLLERVNEPNRALRKVG